MHKEVEIPRIFHEFFGIKASRNDIVAALTFSVIATVLVSHLARHDIPSWSIWQASIFIALSLDITGGIIANLSNGTNRYYNTSSKRCYIFLAVHIQPLILAAIFEEPVTIGALTWCYAVFCALVVRQFLASTSPLAAACLTGIGALWLTCHQLPAAYTALLVLYLVKVIYAFSVDHYPR